MLISEPLHLTDEVLRKYYVGITRAKQRLFIHANFSFFECFNVSQRKTDSNIYEMPNEFELTLKENTGIIYEALKVARITALVQVIDKLDLIVKCHCS
jgi:ATP-dependent exoDNAse (exonuclease V) beta subunit